MKTQTILRKPGLEGGSRCVLSLVLAIVMSLITIQAASGASTSNEEQTLTGNWLVTVTRINPPPGLPPTFLGLVTFFGDGSVLEESNTNLIRSVSHGQWDKTGQRQFTRTLLFFRFDASRNFTGTQKVAATITLSEDGQLYEGEASVEIFDVGGNLVGTGQATEVGNRL